MFEVKVYQCYEIVILNADGNTVESWYNYDITDATEVLEEGRKRAKELEAKQYRTEKDEGGKWRTI